MPAGVGPSKDRGRAGYAPHLSGEEKVRDAKEPTQPAPSVTGRSDSTLRGLRVRERRLESEGGAD